MITFPSAVCCRIVTEANPVSSRRVTDWLWRYRALSPPASAAQLRAPALSCLVCHHCDAPVLIEDEGLCTVLFDLFLKQKKT